MKEEQQLAFLLKASEEDNSTPGLHEEFIRLIIACSEYSSLLIPHDRANRKSFWIAELGQAASSLQHFLLTGDEKRVTVLCVAATLILSQIRFQYGFGRAGENSSEVIHSFVGNMQLELAHNAEKGDFKTWAPEVQQLMNEVYFHIAKLHCSMFNMDNIEGTTRSDRLISLQGEIEELTADTANYMMKAFELYGEAAVSVKSIKDDIEIILPMSPAC